MPRTITYDVDDLKQKTGSTAGDHYTGARICAHWVFFFEVGVELNLREGVEKAFVSITAIQNTNCNRKKC
jgi:hypothetical protein